VHGCTITVTVSARVNLAVSTNAATSKLSTIDARDVRAEQGCSASVPRATAAVEPLLRSAIFVARGELATGDRSLPQ
jgi:hypothetical protein